MARPPNVITLSLHDTMLALLNGSNLVIAGALQALDPERFRGMSEEERMDAQRDLIMEQHPEFSMIDITPDIKLLQLAMPDPHSWAITKDEYDSFNKAPENEFRAHSVSADPVKALVAGYLNRNMLLVRAAGATDEIKLRVSTQNPGPPPRFSGPKS